MKRILSFILIAVLLFALLAAPASANAVSDLDAAETLSALGLLKGTGNGFELERSATRAEAVAMLLRLLGKEQDALAERVDCPFDDGGWAAPLVAYAWKYGLILGQSETHFGSDEPVSARDWLTMLLRVLGYNDVIGEFTWAESIAFADSIGLTHGEYTATGEFLRGDMVLVSCNALSAGIRGSGETLIGKLYRSGAVSGTALRTTRLYGAAVAAASDKPTYNGVEIHEKFVPAVFLVDIYSDKDALEKDRPDSSGTGFFITSDGIAALCYHEMDGVYAMRIKTIDGRRYDVTGVLFYDALWDVAVIRVSRTDMDGNTVRYFPYLELADPDAVRVGETVYLLGNPLGYMDSITDGIVSSRNRNVDDPDYLCIQHSAPASAGSSGSPVLNDRGEVVGIHFASFIEGESMHLAVPVHVIDDVPMTGEGTPIPEIKAIEDAKKAAAVLTADQTEFALEYGEEAEVMISHDYPGRVAIRYTIDDWEVAECAWGDFVTKRSVPLTITAVGDGETEIVISFADVEGAADSSIVLHITVTGTPEEEQPLSDEVIYP